MQIVCTEFHNFSPTTQKKCCRGCLVVLLVALGSVSIITLLLSVSNAVRISADFERNRNQLSALETSVQGSVTSTTSSLSNSVRTLFNNAQSLSRSVQQQAGTLQSSVRLFSRCTISRQRCTITTDGGDSTSSCTTRSLSITQSVSCITQKSQRRSRESLGTRLLFCGSISQGMGHGK